MTKRSLQDLYLVTFSQADELTLKSSGCLKPWACSCDGINDVECGYTAEEAQKYFVSYYQDKATHYASLAPEEFMVELGFYTYQK